MNFSPLVQSVCTHTDTISIPISSTCIPVGMICALTDIISIPVDVLCLPAGMFCSLTHSLWNSYILLFFYAFLRLQFPDVETNPGPRRPVPTVCRLLCSNVLGLAGNLSDLTVASSQYDILLCSETLVSDSCHVKELLVPGFGCPVLLCRGRMPRARGMAVYVRDGYGAFRQPKFECGCCEMLVF